MRSIESDTSEVFINVNDLIIELLLEVDKAQTEHEKKAYRALITRLSDIRDRGHKHSK